MKISTFSIVAGTALCNATCPFCVSKMTGQEYKEPDEPNWQNFAVACKLAKQAGVTTAMITGKGEPTLLPGQIYDYITKLFAAGIPLIELQTNGIRLANDEQAEDGLMAWRAAGLTTVAISIVDCAQEENAIIYGGKHYDLSSLISNLHDIGFSVRLSVVLLKKNSDYAFLDKMVNFAKSNQVEQMTFTPLNAPDISANDTIKQWVSANQPSVRDIAFLSDLVESNGNKLLELAHGAVIYDYKGQNLCLSNCLTKSENRGEMRNLIFYPTGRIMYDWQHKGAIIL